MNKPYVRIAAVAAFAGLAVGVALTAAAPARSQVQAAASYVPIGVSSSGNVSTVWFHEPATRQAVACQTASQGTGLSGIQCISTKLP
jgi:hypothetical protein